jgi:hypothetical protein
MRMPTNDPEMKAIPKYGDAWNTRRRASGAENGPVKARPIERDNETLAQREGRRHADLQHEALAATCVFAAVAVLVTVLNLFNR